MSIVIGIDIGGSTTKIVGFRDTQAYPPLLVTSSDPISSLFGAFGKFTYDNHIAIPEISQVIITGVGAASVTAPIYGLPTYRAAEFDCIGLGALYLSKLEKAVIASLGTGTAVVYSESGATRYLGGTGVGGGTLIGLSKMILGMNHIDNIVKLAEGGQAEKVDLTIGDLMNGDDLQQLSSKLTASNFGKADETASQADVAMGIFNMVTQVVGMICVFASRNVNNRDIVLTGNLSRIPIMHPIFEFMAEQYDVNFIIPEGSGFATAYGAALCPSKDIPLEQVV